MQTYSFTPQGVCSYKIDITVDGDTIEDVAFAGGCAGNLLAISKIIKGRDITEIADIFEGNPCGNRPTSCADQLSQALRQIKEHQRTA